MPPPPVYPLTREVFNRALTTGHGRVLIHAESFDLQDHRDDILDAVTTCRVYDPQVDGHREWWLARLCEAAGLVDTVIQLPPAGDARDLDQRCGLLKEFVLNGHAAALHLHVVTVVAS